MMRAPTTHRVFYNHFICDACETEWCDVMLVTAASWCPACDAAIEPYASNEVEESIIAEIVR
jgi:hypothetical protein